MKSKKEITNLTKGKKKKIKNLGELEKIVSLNLFKVEDLKKLNLISSNTYREYLKKEIRKDYEGSENDEE